MTIFDTISKGIRDVDKRGKLVRRKRRQKAKQKVAKKAGNVAEVKRLGMKKKATNMKRKKAQKQVTKMGQDVLKRAGKAGVVYVSGGMNPASATAAGATFIA
jgi:hypothetical protein